MARGPLSPLPQDTKPCRTQSHAPGSKAGREPGWGFSRPIAGPLRLLPDTHPQKVPLRGYKADGKFTKMRFTQLKRKALEYFSLIISRDMKDPLKQCRLRNGSQGNFHVFLKTQDRLRLFPLVLPQCSVRLSRPPPRPASTHRHDWRSESAMTARRPRLLACLFLLSKLNKSMF